MNARPRLDGDASPNGGTSPHLRPPGPAPAREAPPPTRCDPPTPEKGRPVARNVTPSTLAATFFAFPIAGLYPIPV